MLEAFGVSPHDEALYRKLLRHPAMTADELAEAAGLAVATARRAIRRLEDVGLVARLAGSPVRLMPTRPDVAVDGLVALRQQELARAQAAARTLLDEIPTDRRHAPEELVKVVLGRQAVAQRFLQMVQTASDELLVLDQPPYAQQVDEPNTAEYDLLARGVRCRGIYAPEALEVDGRLTELRELVARGEEARIYPMVPMKLAIADRDVAILPLSFEETADQALVVHGSTLVDALVALFAVLWDLSVPLPPTGHATVPVGGDTPFDEADADFLVLLAAGLTDKAIARQLEVSPRTLSRRLTALMRRLGARTRFQAGVQATLRGLVGTDRPGCSPTDE